MAATLDFTSFFTMAFMGAAPFFTAWLFLIRYLLHANYSPQDIILQLISLQGDLFLDELSTGDLFAAKVSTWWFLCS